MGFSRGPRWSYLDIVATAQNEIIIDSTAGDTYLSTIKMPDFSGRLTQAYLVLTIQQVRNADAVNQNGICGWQKIQLQDSGFTYHDAISIKAGSLYCMPSDVIGGTFEYWGNEDLSAYLEPNGIYSLQWADAEAYNDSLILYGTQMKMRLYFG